MRQLISACESTKLLSGEGKILGVSWNNQSDKFLFDIKKIVDMSDDLCVTKRSVFKGLTSFYDPLGLTQPLFMNMKSFFFQGLCKRKLEWDEELTEALKTEWKALIQSLSRNKIEVGRRFYEDRVGDEIVKGELYAFGDASVEAYGASVYFKSLCKSGYISVSLVSCKSRVAPMKSVSVPRLELLGNLLAARLVDSVITALEKEMKFDEISYWSDCLLTLFWIKSLEKEFDIFVENRLQKIRQEVSDDLSICVLNLLL